MSEEVKPKPRRDARVDQLGFVKELATQYIDKAGTGLKALVKAGMSAGETVEGDFFTGTLFQTSESEIDAVAVFRLFEKKEISKADFLGMIKISASKAKAVLPPKVLAKLTTVSPGSDRFDVKRLPGAEISLVDALKGLGKALLEAA